MHFEAVLNQLLLSKTLLMSILHPHSSKILTIQQGDSYYFSILSNPCSLHWIFTHWTRTLHSPEEVASNPRILWVMFFPHVEPTYNLKATFSTKESMLRWLYFRESVLCGTVTKEYPHYFVLRVHSLSRSCSMGKKERTWVVISGHFTQNLK